MLKKRQNSTLTSEISYETLLVQKQQLNMQSSILEKKENHINRDMNLQDKIQCIKNIQCIYNNEQFQIIFNDFLTEKDSTYKRYIYQILKRTIKNNPTIFQSITKNYDSYKLNQSFLKILIKLRQDDIIEKLLKIELNDENTFKVVKHLKKTNKVSIQVFDQYLIKNPQFLQKSFKLISLKSLDLIFSKVDRCKISHQELLKFLITYLKYHKNMSQEQMKTLLIELKGMNNQIKILVLKFLSTFNNYKSLHHALMISSITQIRMKKFENWEKDESIQGILIFSIEEEFQEIKQLSLQVLQKFAQCSQKIMDLSKELFFNLLNDEFDEIRVLASNCIGFNYKIIKPTQKELKFIFCNIREQNFELRKSVYNLLNIIQFDDKKTVENIINYLEKNSDIFQNDLEIIISSLKQFVNLNKNMINDLFANQLKQLQQEPDWQQNSHIVRMIITMYQEQYRQIIKPIYYQKHSSFIRNKYLMTNNLLENQSKGFSMYLLNKIQIQNNENFLEIAYEKKTQDIDAEFSYKLFKLYKQFQNQGANINQIVKIQKYQQIYKNLSNQIRNNISILKSQIFKQLPIVFIKKFYKQDEFYMQSFQQLLQYISFQNLGNNQQLNDFLKKQKQDLDVLVFQKEYNHILNQSSQQKFEISQNQNQILKIKGKILNQNKQIIIDSKYLAKINIKFEITNYSDQDKIYIIFDYPNQQQETFKVYDQDIQSRDRNKTVFQLDINLQKVIWISNIKLKISINLKREMIDQENVNLYIQLLENIFQVQFDKYLKLDVQEFELKQTYKLAC